MGLFDFFKKKETTETSQETVSLDLTKRKESIKLCLEKKDVSKLIAEVSFALDCSGSMMDEYRDGTVKSIINKIAPIAFTFDDNQTMEFNLFDHELIELPDIKTTNLSNYYESNKLSKYVGGGTSYAPIVLNAIKHAKSGHAKFPMFVIVITDGECADSRETEKALIEASKYDIYFQFVGIGDENFRFLKKLDDLSGRIFDNAGFIQIGNIKTLSDQALYESLISEFVDINKKGILKSAKVTLNLKK